MLALAVGLGGCEGEQPSLALAAFLAGLVGLASTRVLIAYAEYRQHGRHFAWIALQTRRLEERSARSAAPSLMSAYLECVKAQETAVSNGDRHAAEALHSAATHLSGACNFTMREVTP